MLQMLCEILGVKKADFIRMLCASHLKEYTVFSWVILMELKIEYFQKLFSDSLLLFMYFFPVTQGKRELIV